MASDDVKPDEPTALVMDALEMATEEELFAELRRRNCGIVLLTRTRGGQMYYRTDDYYQGLGLLTRGLELLQKA